MRFAFLVILALSTAPSLAQSTSTGGWTVTIGPGGAYVPKFPGADKMEIRLWPIVNVRRTGKEARFITPDDNFGIGLIGDRNFRIGPSLNIQHGRNEADAIPGIGDVGTTIEGGVFAEAFLTDHFRLRADVRKGFGGHKGVVGDVGADVIFGQPADRFHFSVGPRLRLANNRYMQSFYGVSPTQSTLSGLPTYNAGGGLTSAGALTFANYQITPRLGIQAYARYDRLLGDARNSPLVLSSVGSRNQYETGLGLTYSFDIH
jgi:outer membrane protein